MTVAMTIPNNLPPELVAVSDETMALIRDLSERGKAITAIATDQDFAAADALVADARRLEKAIEAERKRLKAPVLDLGRMLDDAASEAITPLMDLRGTLGRLILAYQQAENARREAERRAAEEARAKAEAERLAIIRQQQEARRAAEEAAAAAAPAEEAAPWDEPAAPVAAPVIEPERLPALPIVPVVQALKSSSVMSKTIKRLEIVDAALVPRSIMGVELWTLDTKAVEKLLKAGVAIPGARLTETTITAAKG